MEDMSRVDFSIDQPRISSFFCFVLTIITVPLNNYSPWKNLMDDFCSLLFRVLQSIIGCKHRSKLPALYQTKNTFIKFHYKVN